MDTYTRWFAVVHPDFIKWENITGGEQVKANIEKLDADKQLRRQMLRVLLYHAGVLPKDDFEFLRIMGMATNN
jgi:hypothetical protein